MPESAVEDEPAEQAEESSAGETPPATGEPSEAPTDTADETPAEDKANYTVRLEDFEGPLDLLLYLIQRDEIDIYDIPIAHITQQYLAHLELMDVFNLDNAGEFLVMAASLMRIKARLLLPVQRPEDGEEEEGDPRDELVRRLLEYKKYKEASQQLAEWEDERSQFFGRGIPYTYDEEDPEPPELSFSMVDLLHAVRDVLDEIRSQESHHVYTEVYTVEGQVEVILSLVGGRERLHFNEIFQDMRVRMEVVVTFVALLDLMKNGRIKVQQSRGYGDLWILPATPAEDGTAIGHHDNPPEMSDGATDDEA